MSASNSGKPVDTSSYHVGKVIGAVAARYNKARTTPPSLYDMATILDAMLDAARFAKTDEDRKILRMVEGIGTSRTRQAIVDGLVNKGLLNVEKKGKRFILHATDLAGQLRDKIPAILADVTLTAKWEIGFTKIEKGEVDWRAVVDRTYKLVDALIEQAKAQQGQFKTPAGPGQQPGRFGSKGGFGGSGSGSGGSGGFSGQGRSGSGLPPQRGFTSGGAGGTVAGNSGGARGSAAGVGPAGAAGGGNVGTVGNARVAGAAGGGAAPRSPAGASPFAKLSTPTSRR